MNKREKLIEKRIFAYLDDIKLIEELYSSAYYVHYLMDQLELQKDKYILFSIKHSIIIHLGGIIESVLFQYVYKYFKINNNEKSIKKFCKIVTYKEKTKIIEKNDDSGTGIVYCERKIKFEEFKNNINFNYLIKGAKDNHLLSDKVLNKIDKLRKIRNGIHLNVLMDIREVFSNSELTIFFKDNKVILQEIKEKYLLLKK